MPKYDVVKGDLWEYQTAIGGEWVVIPTNMTIKKNGNAVLGRGVAKQALDKYPLLDMWYGNILKMHQEKVGEDHYIGFAIDYTLGLIMFPVKDYWSEKAQMDILKWSFKQLRLFLLLNPNQKVVMPVVGIGFGEIPIKKVEHLMEKYFKGISNIVVVYRGDKVKKKYPSSFKKAIREDKS